MDVSHLMVTPYAPYRDGIANYAVQEVAARRRAGEDIEVLSPMPSAAPHHLGLGSPRGMAALVKRARHHERVTIQVYPELLFGACRGRRARLAVWGLLAVLARTTALELRVHEIEYDEPRNDPRARQLAGAALRAAAAVTVHTEAERAKLTEAFALPAGTVTLVEHGGSFARRSELTRAEARDSLGVPADAFVYLSIGFVQRHKGFDRGVRALGRLHDPDGRLRLYVVGDVRLDHPDLVEYRDDLDRLCREVPGAEFRSGYVSDEEFDRWLVAADRVVLPYREIWSSSVIERAGLYGIGVIATDVGGLADQAPAGSVIVADDDALADAMAAAAGTSVRAGSGAAEAVPTERDAIQALIRARAGDEDGPVLASEELADTPRGVVESPRPGVTRVKRLVSLLTNWQIEPVAAHLDETIDRLRDDLRTLQDRIDELERHQR